MGLLSLLLAFLTVVGLVILVVGFLTQRNKLKKKWIGGLTFLLAFGGLLFLLSRYGQSNSQSAEKPFAYVQSYYCEDECNEELRRVDLLENFNTPLQLMNHETMVLIDAKSMSIEKKISLNQTTLIFPDKIKGIFSPFRGTFNIIHQDDSQYVLEQLFTDTDGCEKKEVLILQLIQ
ncbi:MAG: hypothetical protein HRT74_00885 [Flavobacteriales bacterium]|nr:hypothetical protein [Flavobacteriales bacterium]